MVNVAGLGSTSDPHPVDTRQRIIQSPQDFEYSTLRLDLVREYEEQVQRERIMARGQIIGQERNAYPPVPLHLELNFRGLEEAATTALTLQLQAQRSLQKLMERLLDEDH